MLLMLSVLSSVFAPLMRFSMSVRAEEEIVMPGEVVDWARVTVEVRRGRKMKKLSSRSRNILISSFRCGLLIQWCSVKLGVQILCGR